LKTEDGIILIPDIDSFIKNDKEGIIRFNNKENIYEIFDYGISILQEEGRALTKKFRENINDFSEYILN
jgi:hypothetical protein